MSTVRYLLRGGPLDGEYVDAPPAILEEAGRAVAASEQDAVVSAPMLTRGDWTYEFSPDEAGVLIARPATYLERLYCRLVAELSS